MDWPNPCRGQAGEGSQSWKGAIAAPERHHLTNCRQASLLTKTPWDSGRFKSTRRVAARDQLPRRDTWHTCKGALVVHPENRMAGMEEAISCSDRARQAPGHLSCLDWGRAQNAGPFKCVPLWRTREPEPEWLTPGKCTQPRARFRQLLAEQPRA